MCFLNISFRLLTDDHCVLCVPIDAVIGAIVVVSARLDRSDDASGVKIRRNTRILLVTSDRRENPFMRRSSSYRGIVLWFSMNSFFVLLLTFTSRETPSILGVETIKERFDLLFPFLFCNFVWICWLVKRWCELGQPFGINHHNIPHVLLRC